MAYRVTFMGLASHVWDRTVERETALEAWALVQHLDDVARITDPFGNEIDWRELRLEP